MAQKLFGLPDGFKTYSSYPFAGVNLQASPLAMQDQEFFWLENFIRTGDGYLRTAWDVGAPIFTLAPIPQKTIVSFNFYTIGSTYYAVVFLSDGTAVQVAVPPTGSGEVTPMTFTVGRFYQASSGFLPAVQQWGDEFIIISNRNTLNDYWVWDGSLLYSAGSLAPTTQTNPELLSGGANYNTAPAVRLFGGSGHGATAVASVQAGSVVNVQVTNPGIGYSPGDIVQGQFSGGGSDTGAILRAEIGGGAVSGVNVTAGGSGYTTASVSFSGGGGTGAAAIATIVGGAVKTINVTNGGTGYTSAPFVSITGDGIGATAQSFLTPTGVSKIIVEDGGSGFTSVPLLQIVGGGGAGATALAAIAPTSIQRINVTAGGTNYTSAPTVSIDGSSTFTTNMVQTLTLVSGGTGYTGTPTVTIVGGSPTSVATATCSIVGGSVASLTLVTMGNGYLATPGVMFTGGVGTGAAATASLSGSSPATAASAVADIAGGVVSLITIVDPGSGYTATPQITISGGGGSGAAAEAVLSPTSIASAIVSSSGSLYTSVPAVEVEAGANNAAEAIFEVMPFGVSGSCIETFNSRVWIGNPAPPLFGNLPPGGNFSFSAAGSFTDFATSDGGGEFSNSDRFLLTTYLGFRQSNGYLYIFGDGSVSVISNIQTTGSPATTTFTYQNVDPQSGLSWRDSLQDFGRSVVFANETGIFGLYGGNVTKISDNLDRLFLNALFPLAAGALTPTSATATIFDVKHYLCLMTIIDPDTGAARNVMATWNEKAWNITSQGVALNYLGTQKVSSKFTAWGTDGTSLYPLFQKPSSSLIKRLDTKIYGADTPFFIKDLWSLHVVAQDLSDNDAGVAGTVTFNMSGPATQQPGFNSALSGVYDSVTLGVLGFAAPSPAWPTWTSGTQGLPFNLLGMRLSSMSPDFVLGNLVLGWVPSSFTN